MVLYSFKHIETRHVERFFNTQYEKVIALRILFGLFLNAGNLEF